MKRKIFAQWRRHIQFVSPAASLHSFICSRFNSSAIFCFICFPLSGQLIITRPPTALQQTEFPSHAQVAVHTLPVSISEIDAFHSFTVISQ